MFFGKAPELTIERPTEKAEIVEAFSNNPINQQIYLITSIRGSGKTVLMTEVCKYFKSMDEWIVIELNPETDMQEGLLTKLNSQAGALIKSLNMNLTFFNVFTIGASLENKITDKETAIIKILEHLKKKHKKVLIAVDEVTNNKNIKVFSSVFQILIRQDLPVFLLMTGLYENIRNLQNEKSLTFLYRSPRINLGPLNITAIKNKYKSVFHLNDDDAKGMAMLTNGYAFGFQALGFLTYRKEGNYKKALDDYRVYLEEYSYNKIWSELSNGDKKILFGIANSVSGRMCDILESCNIDSNHFNPYRKRLIDKGVLIEKGRGVLSFVLPLFKEYILDNYLEDNA